MGASYAGLCTVRPNMRGTHHIVYVWATPLVVTLFGAVQLDLRKCTNCLSLSRYLSPIVTMWHVMRWCVSGAAHSMLTSCVHGMRAHLYTAHDAVSLELCALLLGGWIWPSYYIDNLHTFWRWTHYNVVHPRFQFASVCNHYYARTRHVCVSVCG